MNYGQIKNHFNDVLNRGDITTALTAQFIDSGISRIQRSLRTPMQEKILTVNISGVTPSLTFPADFLEIISFYYEQYELQRVPMKKFRELNHSNVTGSPTHFTREGSKLLLCPKPATGNLVLYYYAEMPALVNDADETALTQVASNLITYSALTFASDFYLDERGALFESKFNQLMLEHQEMANDQEMNGGTQSIQPAYSYQDI